MGGVKLALACAGGLAMAGQIASMPAQRRQALISAARLIVGQPPPPEMRAASLAAPAELPPKQAIGPGSLQTESIAPDQFGQFQTQVEVEGQRLPVLVDTGASFVALSFEDAGHLGLRPMPADFKYLSSTANGSVAYAKAELPRVRLGSIEVHNVIAFIGPRGALSTSLLGMSFLGKLSGFKVDGGRLVLQQ